MWKSNLWPINEYYENYSEDDLFDMMEFFHDCVSKPIDGIYHSYGDCGWHYHTFRKEPAQREFRSEVNYYLGHYKGGYELSEAGDICVLLDPATEALLQEPLPEYDRENVEMMVEAAILKFKRRNPTSDDRQDAIRHLADVLEFLRPKLKKVLASEDEDDLFNLANNFGIRHHNERQKTEYDRDVWYTWMFCYYLATIYASIRLIKKQAT